MKFEYEQEIERLRAEVERLKMENKSARVTIQLLSHQDSVMLLTKSLKEARSGLFTALEDIDAEFESQRTKGFRERVEAAEAKLAASPSRERLLEMADVLAPDDPLLWTLGYKRKKAMAAELRAWAETL